MHSLLLASFLSCFGYQPDRTFDIQKPLLLPQKSKKIERVRVKKTSKSTRKKIAYTIHASIYGNKKSYTVAMPQRYKSLSLFRFIEKIIESEEAIIVKSAHTTHEMLSNKNISLHNVDYSQIKCQPAPIEFKRQLQSVAKKLHIKAPDLIINHDAECAYLDNTIYIHPDHINRHSILGQQWLFAHELMHHLYRDDITTRNMQTINEKKALILCRFQEVRADCLAALAHPSLLKGFKQATTVWAQESNIKFDSQSEHPPHYMRLELAQLLERSF